MYKFKCRNTCSLCQHYTLMLYLKQPKFCFYLYFLLKDHLTNKKTHIVPISCKNTINQLSSLKLRPLGWINAEETPNEPIFCIISFPWA